jgi:LytS/YehU family sensor histidine kinase
VPLKEELLATKNYFSIEEVRFGKKLKVIYDIDPHAEEIPVPGFILHPLIENSVKYGLETGSLPLQIVISARNRNNTLVIEVKNSGKWFSRDNTYGTGTGLKNVKDRLQTLYPDRHNVIYDTTDGFVRVILEIKREPDEPVKKESQSINRR